MADFRKLREAGAAAALPALQRPATGSLDDEDIAGDQEVEDHTCTQCQGTGVSGKDVCPKCAGTGQLREAAADGDSDGDSDGGEDTKTCPTCGGSGKLRGGNLACPDCQGSGEVASDWTKSKEAEATLCVVCLTADCEVEGVARLKEAELTAAARKRIPKRNFAVPSKAPASGSYPIHDPAHARNALARASGKPEEATVKAAVYKKYPDLKPSTESMSLLDRLEALEASAGVFRSLREAKPAAMTPTFSTPARVKTAGGQEGYRVVLIREGRGNAEDDQWYPASAIREMCESRVAEGMQAYANHPDLEEEEKRPERDVKHLVGSYHDVRFAESDGPPRAEAVFVPFTTNEEHPTYGWVVTLAEAASRSTSPQPLCGISLYGLSAGDDGNRPDGTQGRIVSMIRPTSGDIVTSAGAGGGFIRSLMESARARTLRNRTTPIKELTPMKTLEFQRAVREAAKRVREATSEEERNTALEALEHLETEKLEEAPNTVEQLTEAAPGLVKQIQESVEAQVKESDDDLKAENEQLRGQLRESQGALSQFTDVMQITDVLRECEVSDPKEMKFFISTSQARGLREAADIRDLVQTEREYQAAQRETMLEKLRESQDWPDVEGVLARVPATVADGGVAALQEAGVPIRTAE